MLSRTFIAAALSVSFGVANGMGFGWTGGMNLIELSEKRKSLGLDGIDPTEVVPDFAYPVVASNHSNSTSVRQYWADLPIDHFGDCSPTYKNRYWVQDRYYRPGGPVFLFDNGESNAASSVPWLKHGFFARMLKEFGGIGILWEHRYYGESDPSTNRQWLTAEQALADVAVFASKFSVPSLPHVDLTAGSTPWLFVGASYPGIRAALMREKYPETIFASWAGSAPVETRVDFSEYYLAIIAGMDARGLGGCRRDVQAVTARIDELLDDPRTAHQVKSMFNMGHLTNGDLGYRLHSILGTWQQSLEAGGIGKGCEFLETDPITNRTAGPSGWAPTKGVDWVLKRYAHLVNALGFTTSEVDLRDSWTWQTCTQMGFFQVSGPEIHHLISKHVNLDWWKESICQQGFPGGVEAGVIPPSPSAGVAKFRSQYGGWSMRPSNTFWTADEFDPWRALTPLSPLADAPAIQVSTDIPAAGVAQSEAELFGAIVANGYHAAEFFESPDAKRAQQTWSAALHKWLPAYKRHAYTVDVPKQCPPGAWPPKQPGSGTGSGSQGPTSTPTGTPTPTGTNSPTSTGDGDNGAGAFRPTLLGLLLTVAGIVAVA